ncbi:MAG TPA: type II toxin-antitoxin system HicB family antitoxin [Ktedonobacterales bacterium]|jgi:predicted RNase H-like HicB family nuclease|nr:type II toxin-antitoxin system HicB family antitoxin [Ktedonobacterales bacterium]
MSETSLRYTIVIQWSNEDDAYVVSLPEWGDLVHTHGDTYAEALQRGQELLELLVQSRRAHSEALPEPHVFA